jgi:hypothetical protein
VPLGHRQRFDAEEVHRLDTINKWASGRSDTLALGLLNEAIGPTLP